MEVSRIFQERSSRAITPMSLPSVRGTPTASFELYHPQMNPSRSEQPTPVIRHFPSQQQQQQQLFHNRTNSYTQATSQQQQQPHHQPYQSPIQQIYNPIHSDGPVKRRYLQVHQPMSPAQPQTQIYQHQKSGSCSSAISSQGSSSLVGPGAASFIQGPLSPGELACDPASAFEMQVHVRKQSSVSAGRETKLFLVLIIQPISSALSIWSIPTYLPTLIFNCNYYTILKHREEDSDWEFVLLSLD